MSCPFRGGCPVGDELHGTGGSHQLLALPWVRDPLRVHVRRAPPRRRERNLVPIRREHGRPVDRRIRRDGSGLTSPRQVEDPNVGSAATPVQYVNSNFLTVRRKIHEEVIGRLTKLPCVRAIAPIPDQPGRRRAGLVGQDARARHGEVCLAEIAEVQDVLGYHGRRTRNTERPQVEVLRDQVSFPHEEQMAGLRIQGTGIGLCDQPGFLRVHGSDADLARFAHRPRVQEKMPPVRQKRRPPVEEARPLSEHDSGGSAGRWNPDHITRVPSRSRHDARDEYGVVRSPGGKLEERLRGGRKVTNRLRSAAVDRHALQLGGGEESDRPAVGRPERPRGAIRGVKRHHNR